MRFSPSAAWEVAGTSAVNVRQAKARERKFIEISPQFGSKWFWGSGKLAVTI
jgi:hypothetical protein